MRTPPIWSGPVGLGANLTLTSLDIFSNVLVVSNLILGTYRYTCLLLA